VLFGGHDGTYNISDTDERPATSRNCAAPQLATPGTSSSARRPEDVHRGRAGLQLDAECAGGVEQLGRRGDALVPHEPREHGFGPRPPKLKRWLESAAMSGRRISVSARSTVFLPSEAASGRDGLHAPEGEEQRDLHVERGRHVGEHQRGRDLLELAGDDAEGQPALGQPLVRTSAT
jgi:hypothetical protein